MHAHKPTYEFFAPTIQTSTTLPSNRLPSRIYNPLGLTCNEKTRI